MNVRYFRSHLKEMFDAANSSPVEVERLGVMYTLSLADKSASVHAATTDNVHIKQPTIKRCTHGAIKGECMHKAAARLHCNV